MAKKWICSVCGYVHEGDEAPERCPQCRQPKEKFKELKDDKLNFVTEHVIGIAADTDDQMKKDLNAHFMGEATEVGMYLAMSRQADREGYPEVAEAFKRYAWEEAEHCAKFAELLGDVPSTTPFTKWLKTKPVTAKVSKVSSTVISANKPKSQAPSPHRRFSAMYPNSLVILARLFFHRSSAVSVNN